MNARTDNAATEHQLFELIDLIYSAVGDVTLWSVVLDRLAEALHGRQTVLFGCGPESSASDASALARMDPADLIPYASHYAAINVLSHRCDALYPTGTVRYGNRAVPDPEFRRTEIFTDYFRPLDIDYSFGIKIAVDDTAPMYLALMRPRQDGPFGQLTLTP